MYHPAPDSTYQINVSSATMSNEDNQNGSIACAVEVPVSGQADMDDMWMTRGANKTNVTRQGSNLSLSRGQAHHGTPRWLTGLRTTSSTLPTSLIRNRNYTSIHHVSRADQYCAVLKRAENIMRHVEMWAVVRQKGTVCASRKMCSKLKGSVTKSCKFISRVKHHEQRIILARMLKKKTQ